MKQTLKGFLPISNEEYHKHPAIGSTTLCRARRSWAHAMTPMEQTDAMALGSAFHALVGEPELFAQKYARRPDGIKLNTNVGKEAYAAFQAANPGKTILDGDDYDRLDGMLHSILCHPLALNVLTDGIAEQAAFAQDPDTGVMLKCKPDYYRPQTKTVVDIKTATDASADAFQRSLVTFGRHIQTALYLDVVSAVTGEKHENFVHVVIEKTPPYGIAVYALDDLSIEQGRREYKALLKEYATCQRLDEYPAYPATVQTIGLRNWEYK